MRTTLAMTFSTCALLALTAAGCGKKDDAAAATGASAGAAPGKAPAKAAGGCAPRKVTVDGQDVPNLRGLAVTLKNGEYLTEQVELYDTDQITCAQVLAPSYPFPAGAVALRAYYHPQAQGLGTEAYTAMDAVSLKLAHKADKVGDTTTICVAAGASFTPNTGSFTGKKVEVSGALEGVYCGVKDMTAR